MFLINGKKIASRILHTIRHAIVEKNLTPGLAIILVGNDPASEIYVKRKFHTAHTVGITPNLYRFHEHDPQKSIIECIDFLNNDPEIHGCIVQLPLPHHLDPDILIPRILPDKDADGFHPENLKHLGDPRYPQPVTAMSVMECLEDAFKKGNPRTPPLKGERGMSSAAVICKSDTFFTPLSQLLSQQNIQADHLYNVNKKCIQYDILIIALGKPHILTKEYTKKDAIIIDVGINRIEKNGTTIVAGDADSESLKDHISALTPVPGGVGPVTVALLLKNTVENCVRITKK